MVVVPAETPVTIPEIFTVATLGAVLLHIPPVAGSVNVVLVVGQIVNVPDIEPATGLGFTVITAVAATVPQVLVIV